MFIIAFLIWGKISWQKCKLNFFVTDRFGWFVKLPYQDAKEPSHEGPQNLVQEWEGRHPHQAIMDDKEYRTHKCSTGFSMYFSDQPASNYGATVSQKDGSRLYLDQSPDSSTILALKTDFLIILLFSVTSSHITFYTLSALKRQFLKKTIYDPDPSHYFAPDT